MENISSTAELINEIQILEAEQAGHLYQMREKFNLTLESLKPVNIIGNSVKEIVSTPNLGKKILGIAAGLLTGYLSSKVINIGASNNIFRRILGNVVKFGVAGVVARNPKFINSVRQFIAERIFRRRQKYNINP